MNHSRIHRRLLYITCAFTSVCVCLCAGISNAMLSDEFTFKEIATSLNEWFGTQLGDSDTGVLVSHNVATDIQFLLCEYLRAGVQVPPQITLGMDTLKTLKRFKSLVHHKVALAEWPELTAKGARSMCVKHICTYVLAQRDPAETFEEACGSHHDADADTKAVAIILFDKKEFGNAGLQHCVFHSQRRCCFPLHQVWTDMREKLKEPVIKFEPLPPGWVSAPLKDASNSLSGSSDHLPDGVDEVKEQPFRAPRFQRGEGQPSPELRQHLGVGSTRTGTTFSGTTFSIMFMMVKLFLFFFTMSTLDKIAMYTNAKALEEVHKLRYTRSDGSIHYKVLLCACMFTHTHTLLINIAVCTARRYSNMQLPTRSKSRDPKIGSPFPARSCWCGLASLTRWVRLVKHELLIIGAWTKTSATKSSRYYKCVYGCERFTPSLTYSLSSGLTQLLMRTHSLLHSLLFTSLYYLPIQNAMKENRYMSITANLSFAPRGAASGWEKIGWLDEVLRAACRAATGTT